MSLQRLSGIVIIAGFALWLGAMFSSPHLYDTEDLDVRMQTIEAQQSRWIASQVLFGLGILVPALGFAILSAQQKTALFYVGAGLFALGSVFGALIVYNQTLDPLAFWQNTNRLSDLARYFAPVEIGLILIGVGWLQSSLPGWAGYMLVGTSILALVGAVVFISQAFLIVSVTYIVTLMTGIALVVKT